MSKNIRMIFTIVYFVHIFVIVYTYIHRQIWVWGNRAAKMLRGSHDIRTLRTQQLETRGSNYNVFMHFSSSYIFCEGHLEHSSFLLERRIYARLGSAHAFMYI